MTLIKNANPDGEVDLGKLERLEKNIGLPFPEDYRAYLLNYNGGCFSPSGFDTKTDFGISSLHHMYRVASASSYLDLCSRYEAMKRDVPYGFVPIADDPVGNFVLVKLVGAGGVYYLNHENLSSPPSFLSDSFESFVASLFECGDELEDSYDILLSSDDIDRLKALLASGANIEKVDDYNHSLLEKAVILDKPVAVRLILEKEPDIRDSLVIAKDNKELFPGEYEEVYDLLMNYENNRAQ